MAGAYSDYIHEGKSPQYAYALVILGGGIALVLPQFGVRISDWLLYALIAALFGFLWPYKPWRWVGWLCLPVILLGLIDMLLVGIAAGLLRNGPIIAKMLPAAFLGAYIGSKLSVRKLAYRVASKRAHRNRLKDSVRAAQKATVSTELAAPAANAQVITSTSYSRAPVQTVEVVEPSEGLNAALMKAAQEGDADRIRQLVAEGADVNTTESDERWTPLMVAAGGCEIEMVKTLFGEGAVLDAADVKGWTALMIATIEGHREVVRALLEHGAAVNAKNNKGWTALRFAVSMGETDILHLLLDAGADANIIDDEGKTALMQAADENIIESLTALLNAGADTHIKDGKGRTALMIARKQAHSESIKLIKEAEARASNGFDWRVNILDDPDSYFYLLKEELEEGLNSRPADDVVSHLLSKLQEQIDAANRERSLAPSEISHKLALTLKEAAALSGLPRQHLLEAIEAGKLKAQLLKQGWRIRRADLDAYIRRLLT